MNSLGAGLVWSGVQVSLLVLAGGLVYALLRRRGPAAGSVVTLALLVIAIGLPILSLAPWPNWWRLHVAEATAADGAPPKAESADASTASQAAVDSKGSRAGLSPPPAGVGQTSLRRHDLGARVLEEPLGRTWRPPDCRIRYILSLANRGRLAVAGWDGLGTRASGAGAGGGSGLSKTHATGDGSRVGRDSRCNASSPGLRTAD